MISYVVEHNVEGELEAGFVEGNANEEEASVNEGNGETIVTYLQM